MRVEEKILTEAQIEAQNLHIEAQIEVQKSQNFRRRDWPRSSRLSCSSSRAAIPPLAFWCASSTSFQAPSLFSFSFRRPWFSRMDLVPLRFSSRCLLQQPIPAYMRLSVDCLFLRSPSRVPYRTELTLC